MNLHRSYIKQKNNYAALYMRISKEDNRLKESASIENQRKYLLKFIENKDIIVYDEYIDDGYSGTNMNRPALNRMKTDIENGKIGIVLTKDFSRLGRNSGRVQTMLDEYFTMHRIRYIAVSEGIDTMMAYNTNNLITPVLSFTNEMYAGDISRKIRASFSAKMANGEFIGAFAPYGYKKNPRNKNHLILDNESSKIVNRIFEYAKYGYSPNQIAKILNFENILTPSFYRCKVHTHISKNSFKTSKEWTISTISKILRNEVYLGHTLQGKTVKPNFKSKHTFLIPKKNWIRIENTHEPIITQETWNIVRKKMQNRIQKKYII